MYWSLIFGKGHHSYILFSTYHKQLVPRAGGVSAHEVLATIHERSMSVSTCIWAGPGACYLCKLKIEAPRYQLKENDGKVKH